jgi:hypothetical protein
LDWDKVRTRAELLALRTRQLQGRDEDLEEVRLQKQRKRMEGKESFDQSRQIRQSEIKEGDLVLRHDSIAEINMSQVRKLSYKWLGLYRVRKAIPDKGTYFLEEFDGTALAGTYSGNRLKKFVQRNRFYTSVATGLDEGSDSSSVGNSTDDEDDDQQALDEVTVRRSARIQENAQRQVTRPGRFEIVPPQLTEEQRRQYVRYEEDKEGNLI